MMINDSGEKLTEPIDIAAQERNRKGIRDLWRADIPPIQKAVEAERTKLLGGESAEEEVGPFGSASRTRGLASRF